MFCSLLLRSYWQVPGSQDGDVDSAPDKTLAKAKNRFDKNMPECPPVQYRKKDERFSVKRTVEIANLYYVQIMYYEIMTNNNGNVMIDIDENTSENKLNSGVSSSVIHKIRNKQLMHQGAGKTIVGLCNCSLHHPPCSMSTLNPQ